MVASRTSGQANANWCLEFADTLNWRTSQHAEEGIPTYEDLIAWSVKEGVLHKDEVLTLTKSAEEDPSKKESVVNDAHNLREAIYHIFSAVSHGRRVDSVDLDVLNETLSKGLGRKSLKFSGSGFSWSWKGDLPMEVVLFKVAHSAADLLTSEDLIRVKECANEEQGCGSLFIDNSKGHTRRWCSMDSCGNRVKLRTYYKRHKDDASVP